VDGEQDMTSQRNVVLLFKLSTMCEDVRGCEVTSEVLYLY
jgi:hypothetical protein